MKTGVVVIGRNEGARLVACLRSVIGDERTVVYVDSGSTDNSVADATALGAHVVALDMKLPFTAARARNSGFAALKELGAVDGVHFVDGDCEVVPGWLDFAETQLAAAPKLGVVCGRRRERFPQASIFNSLADREWNTPIGAALACGGDALFRARAFDEAQGYNETLIAGEEPELCLRLREAGWEIERLDHEMTLHDLAVTKWQQWWRRSARAGHAFAEVSSLHKSSPKRIWAAETRRALLWASFAPLCVVGAAIVHPVLLLGLLIYPLQIVRVARHLEGENARGHAALLTLGKFAEARGALQYFVGRLLRKKSKLMEYKT